MIKIVHIKKCKTINIISSCSKMASFRRTENVKILHIKDIREDKNNFDVKRSETLTLGSLQGAIYIRSAIKKFYHLRQHRPPTQLQQQQWIKNIFSECKFQLKSEFSMNCSVIHAEYDEGVTDRQREKKVGSFVVIFYWEIAE